MKVLVVSHSCVTDVNQQLFVSLEQLPGVELQLIIPARWKSEYSGKHHAPSMLPSLKFHVYQQPIMVPGNVSLHFYMSLPIREIKKFGPDIILSTQEPWSLSNFQALWLSKSLRIPFLFQTNQNLVKHLPPPFSWMEQLSYRHSSAALAYSEEARQVMIRKGQSGPSFVVPYGTDLSLFTPGTSSLRENLGLEDTLVIGYIGRLVPEKGLDTLVQAVTQILLGNPEAKIKVLLVGSGPAETSLKAMIDEAGLSGRFVFTGAVPHHSAGEYMRCINIFVVPSKTMPNWKEQFGRVIIEAMACKVPVIGSDSGEIPNLIKATGGGLVFREGDAADLAKKLNMLIQDSKRRENMGDLGNATVQRKYTFEAVAQQLSDILRNCLNSRVAA